MSECLKNSYMNLQNYDWHFVLYLCQMSKNPNVSISLIIDVILLIFYFISLNWCYYCHVFNDLFLKSRNILALHTTNVYIKYNVHQKCQELMVPDTPSVSESFAVRHHLLLAFGLIRQNNSLLCEWPIESIGKCAFFSTRIWI